MKKCKQGTLNTKRFDALLRNIEDWNLFLIFCAIDGISGDKDGKPLEWLLNKVSPIIKLEIDIKNLVTLIKTFK